MGNPISKEHSTKDQNAELSEVEENEQQERT